MGHYRQPLRYAARQWRTLAVILVLTVAAGAAAALEPWPIKLLIDHALGGQPLPPRLAALLGATAAPARAVTLLAFAAVASLALFAVGAVFNIAVSWLWAVAGQRMVFDLSTDLFHRLQRLSLGYHARTPVGDSLSRLGGDTWSVYVLSSRLFAPFEQLLVLGTVGLVAYRLNARLALLSLAAAPVLAGLSLWFGPRLKSEAKGGREAHCRLTSFVHQTLTALPVVQAFTAEGRNRQRFRALSDEVVTSGRRAALVGSVHGLTGGLVTALGSAFILYTGGREVLRGALSVGGLVVFLSYLRKIHQAAETLLRTYGSVKPVEASIDRVFEVLDSSEHEVRERSGARAPARRPGSGVEVSFEEASFGYQPGRPVLEGVSLRARPGETVALVGATGAGKSTLVSLIPRFHDVWSGRVTWDGADVRDLKLSALRAEVSLVLQEPFLFPITVAENIAYGCPHAARRDIISAAEAANADAFIRQLPEGYDTVLGEHGNTLSGGERQRLAIARALLKDASVVVLDEPTSALDAATEAQVVEAVRRLVAGRTTFIIAHRLSTIRGADQIAVLDGGRLVDAGDHQSLVARCQLYRRLHALQERWRPEAVA
jgi:ATP-binding cassette subfamily B protein/subfamily B ATP-binding cassette protein MsbA